MMSKPDRPVPMKMRKMPKGQGQELAFDFLDAGKYKKEILVGIDYYSRYVHLAIQSSTGADKTIRNMQLIFAKFSWPMSITVDNGPPFASKDFKDFCDIYGIKIFHTPRYAQANGLVERMNANLKKRIAISWNLKSKDWKYDLEVTYVSAYHSSVHSTTGKTPFEMMFGRRMNTKLPSLAVDYQGTDDDARDKDTTEKHKMKERADSHRHATESKINVGDTVLVVLVENSPKTHKHAPNFGPDEFIVVEKKGGSDCVIHSGSSRITRRQITSLKKVSQHSRNINISAPATNNNSSSWTG
jgi:hypothetical protein